MRTAFVLYLLTLRWVLQIAEAGVNAAIRVVADE